MHFIWKKELTEHKKCVIVSVQYKRREDKQRRLRVTESGFAFLLYRKLRSLCNKNPPGDANR